MMNKFFGWLQKRYGQQSETAMDVHEFRGGIRSLLSSDKTDAVPAAGQRVLPDSAMRAEWAAKLLSYEYVKASLDRRLACSRELRRDLKQLGATG